MPPSKTESLLPASRGALHFLLKRKGGLHCDTPWVRAVLCHCAFFELLLGVDLDLLSSSQAQPCPHCGGRLHRGDYRRKPRGEPEDLPEGFSIRFSLCCSQDGCRRRLTPFSVRFLARRVYVGAAVVLVAAAMQGLSPARVRRLSKVLRIPPRTARRWLAWWQSTFAESRFFRSIRGLLRQPIEAEALPLGLLDVCARGQPGQTALTVLEPLQPITSCSAPGAQPI